MHARRDVIERAGRVGIEESSREFDASFECVLPAVRQHVTDGIPRLVGTPKYDQVVAVGNDPPLSAHEQIEPLRQAIAERAHDAGEVRAVFYFEDQMNVVALYRVMGRTRPQILYSLEGGSDDAECPVGSQAPYVTHHSHGHVNWMPPFQSWAGAVGDGSLVSQRSRPLWLPSRTLPGATPVSLP